MSRKSIRVYTEDWLKTLTSRGLSEKTIRRRRSIVEDFLRISKIRTCSDIHQKEVDDYQVVIGAKLGSVNTQRTRLSTVNDFLEYLGSRNLLLLVPYLELPRHVSSLPRDIFTEKEIAQVLGMMNEPRYVRLRAMTELFYSTGIRRQELLNLDLYDLDMNERTLFIREGKGKKDRLLPVARIALKAVKTYVLTERSKYSGSDPALFVNKRGERLNDNDLQSFFYKFNNRFKLSKRLTPHALRHSIATHLLRRDVDIRYVQAFLGHAHLSTTQIYTRIVKKDLRKAVSCLDRQT